MRRVYYLRGLGIEMLGALLIAWLVSPLPGLSYWDRARVAGIMGLSAGVLARLPDWNWWGFSRGFTLMAILDLTLTWLFAGLVIAKIVGDRRTS